MTGVSSKSWVRPPAVSGTFYPDQAQPLAAMVDRFLDEARRELNQTDVRGGPGVPRALIAPHAGYVYSGPIAASAYVRLEALEGTIRRVVLIGPSHRVAVGGGHFSRTD